jgi:drug/metabolite transporter (DMT)-like permease
MELLTIFTGLSAAVAWGAGDFAGGMASRRVAAVRVILVSQVLGSLLIAGLVLVRGEPLPPPTDLMRGALAGVGGGLGLFLLYYSLAQGKMGVAAPLTAVAAAGIPLVVGVWVDGAPPPVTLAGFLLALAAIWMISHPDGGAPLRTRDVGVPLLAGVGFGLYLTLIGGIETPGALFWPLLAARATSITTLAIVLLAWPDRGRGGAAFPWALALLAGMGDTIGTSLFAVTAQIGRLDVAAVLSSLYPVATVLLARLVLAERMTRRQNAGVGLALAAVVLIAI